MKKIWYVVTCEVHGKKDKGINAPFIKVPEPKNKKARLTGGCPHCKQMELTHEKV